MRHEIMFKASCIVFGIVCTGMVTHVTLASTIENAVDTTGLTGFVSLAYGDHTINSGLANVVEVDSYTFQGTTGDPLRIVISTLSNGLDPQIVLRDPVGALVQTTSCNGSSGGFATRCSTHLDQVLPSSGLYTLNVSDINSDETGSYSLHLDQYPPTNNWVGFAYDSPVLDQLGHVSDMDFLAFNGAAGTGVRVVTRSLTNGLDPELQIWDPLGSLIYNNYCDGSSGGFATTCTTSAVLDLSLTGIYKLGLRDVGWNETGGYDLGVSCLYGACPTTAPTPAVPLPPAVWLFGSGVLGLVGIARRIAT